MRHVSRVTPHLALSPILAAMSRRLAGVTSSSMATLEKWQPAPSGSSTVHSSCSALGFVNDYLTLNEIRYLDLLCNSRMNTQKATTTAPT